jgi:hypothetical protein
MKTRRRQVLVRLALAASLVATPAMAAFAQEQAEAQNRREHRAKSVGSLTVPVSGVVTPQTGPLPSSPLTGTFAIRRFVQSDDGIVAVGTLTASFTDPLTGVARTLVTRAALPVDRENSGGQGTAVETDDVPLHGPAVAAQPACDILNLVLGPLDLNLLGLRIQLNRVVLDITAVPGAGNLLGNLLCAIVGLLDGGGPLARLIGLLNDLLDMLG